MISVPVFAGRTRRRPEDREQILMMGSQRPLSTLLACFGYAIVACIAGTRLYGQSPFNQVRITRAVETNASYPDEPIASVDVDNCPADNLVVHAFWSDSGEEILRVETVPHPVPKGKYKLFSSRKFPTTNSLSVRFRTLVHCVGAEPGEGGWFETPTSTVRMCPQIPVYLLKADKTDLKAGETIN